MIIVKFIGGLGNQMFQYAFYRFIKEKYGNVKADITGFETYQLHNGFELEKIFNLSVEKADFRDISIVKELSSKDILSRVKRKLFGIRKSHVLEKDFNEKILNNEQMNFYLDGYWGSEKYFKGIKDIIHNDFSVKKQPNKQNQIMINKILNSESVSIHIRRGDYVDDKDTNKLFETCSMEYYNSAIVKIKEKFTNPHFFIFSDDPEWTLKNMKISFPTTYVNINGADKDYEDLRLMSLCKHNIIANSTFSWWGAWLNNNPDKIVIAPKKWFADPIRNAKINFDDLYPKDWIIL